MMLLNSPYFIFPIMLFFMSAHDLFRTEWSLLKLWGYVEVRYIC